MSTDAQAILDRAQAAVLRRASARAVLGIAQQIPVSACQAAHALRDRYVQSTVRRSVCDLARLGLLRRVAVRRTWPGKRSSIVWEATR